MLIGDMARCEELGSVAAELLPSLGERFKLWMGGPGSTTMMYQFAVAGEEVEKMVAGLALCAGLI